MTSALDILVVGDGDARARLRAAGLRVVGPDATDAPGHPRAVVVDARTRSAGEVARIAAAARAGGRMAGRIPVLALAAGDAAPPAAPLDGLVLDTHPPAQIRARIAGAVREVVMRQELEVRRATLARCKVVVPPDDDAAGEPPPRVLLVGEPSPQMLAVCAGLEAEGCDVVGALSSFTGFDYLHAAPFDALLAAASAGWPNALAMIATLRRNTALFHLPAVFVAEGARLADVDHAFARGADDVLDPAARVEPAARRIRHLAELTRRRARLRRAFDAAKPDQVRDPATNLYNGAFFLAHLQAMIDAAEGARQPLSVLALKAPRSLAGRGRLRALAEAGDLIGRLVRVEDAAARLDGDTFVIAMPGAGHDEARNAGERIGAVLDCIAFDDGAGGEAPLPLAACALERATGETARQVMARVRALTEPALAS